MSREDIEEQERAHAEQERLTAAAARHKHGARMVRATDPLPKIDGLAWAKKRSQNADAVTATALRQEYLAAFDRARIRLQSFLGSIDEGTDPWIETKSEPCKFPGMTKLEADLLAAGLRSRTFEVEVKPSTRSSGKRTLGRGEDETFDVLITDPVLTLKL